MTIDKAIDTLEEIKQLTAVGDNQRDRRALQLGIEALKREKEYRPRTGPRNFDLLPGETKK